MQQGISRPFGFTATGAAYFRIRIVDLLPTATAASRRRTDLRRPRFAIDLVHDAASPFLNFSIDLP